jgi:UDP-N-acetylglucosamine 2-epimerase (non-hydrolysing)
MEEAAVMMVGLDPARVRQGLSILGSDRGGSAHGRRIVGDYTVPDVSAKVVRLIHSYTDYVNRVVWRKHGSVSG